MHQVSAVSDRQTAERLSDLITDMDPSPAAAVSTEETSRHNWRITAYCLDEELAQSCATILETESPGLRASITPLEDKDWVAESLKGLPAVSAGPYVVAGAHELVRLHDGRIPIWIEAGPAFGTGHHGTTRGCLLALADTVRRKPLGKVLDVGTGSGVLAIAGAKSGASMIVASDIDAESVRIARINAANNRTGRRIRFHVASGVNDASIRSFGKFDTVMANILARPLIRLSADIEALTSPGGTIILSGLLSHQEPLVRAAYAGRGLVLKDRRRLGAWSTLTFIKPKPAQRVDQWAARRASRAMRRFSKRGRLGRE